MSGRKIFIQDIQLYKVIKTTTITTNKMLSHFKEIENWRREKKNDGKSGQWILPI